jgi:ferritin
MFAKKLDTAMSQQFNMELYSSYIYLAAASYLNTQNLEGFSHWMNLQVQEELQHAAKFYHYILEREGNLVLTDVKAPPKTFKSPLAACEAALAHERKNTKQINALMDIAIAAKDHACAAFLQWFVDEQVEEEAQTSQLVENVKMVKDSGGALFMLDRELAKRQMGPTAEGA